MNYCLIGSKLSSDFAVFLYRRFKGVHGAHCQSSAQGPPKTLLRHWHRESDGAISSTFGYLQRPEKGHRLLRLNFYSRVKVFWTCFSNIFVSWPVTTKYINICIRILNYIPIWIHQFNRHLIPVVRMIEAGIQLPLKRLPWQQLCPWSQIDLNPRQLRSHTAREQADQKTQLTRPLHHPKHLRRSFECSGPPTQLDVRPLAGHLSTGHRIKKIWWRHVFVSRHWENRRWSIPNKNFVFLTVHLAVRQNREIYQSDGQCCFRHTWWHRPN